MKTVSDLHEIMLALAPPGQRAKRRAIIEAVHGPLHKEMLAAGINTPLRIAHFLAQIAHESAGFATLTEYASGEAYEGRGDLGNTRDGDGKLFKGRGLIQLTGRANYKTYGKIIGKPLERQPKLAERPDIAAQLACAYWTEHKLNPLADADNLRAITRRINGGFNGLQDRLERLQKAKRLLGLTVSGMAPGEDGPHVEVIQSRLTRLGYFTGRIDGKFGPRTRDALMAFERDNGLAVDGIASAADIEALGDAAPRAVSDARAKATAGELLDNSRIVNASAKTGSVGAGLTAGGGLALMAQVGAGVGLVNDTIRPIREFFTENGPVIALAVAACGLFILWQSRRAIAARLADHRSGRTL